MRKAFLLLFAAILMIKPISLQAKERFCYEDYKIPEEYISYFEEYGVRANICPELLESIAFYESRFKKDVSNENCVGIMQIDIKVHSDRIKSFGYEVDDMYDPDFSCMNIADSLNNAYTKGKFIQSDIEFFHQAWKEIEQTAAFKEGVADYTFKF